MRTTQCLNEQIAAFRDPAISPQEFLMQFAKTVPQFSTVAAEYV
jgi:hypothetical protein